MKRNRSLSACAIVALAGSSAGAQVIDWAAPVDGNWNDAINWNPANVPNTNGEDAVLGLVGAYSVDITSTLSINGLSIPNPDATLNIGSGQSFSLQTGLMNNGLIVVNTTSTVFDAALRFDTDLTLSGSGSVMLNAVSDPNDAKIFVNTLKTLTHANGHLIHGSGRVDGTIINAGDIIADFPLGSGLRLIGTYSQTASGRIGADSGTLLLGNNSVTTGGELLTINGGIIQVEGSSAIIGNITNSGQIDVPGNGNTLVLNGDLQHDGTIRINSNGTIFNSHMRFDADATISGTGTITMGLGSTDLNDAQISTNGAFTGTIGSGQTISGAGKINGGNNGNIVNLGTMIANVPDTQLQLLGSISGDGDYLSNGGIIGFGSALILDGGTFDSTGDGIAKHVANGTSTLSNIINNGQMGVNGNGGVVALAGPMTNNGTFNINDNGTIFNAHLRFDTATAITGNGTIHMQIGASDLNDAQLFTNGAFNGTIGASQTVDGSGRIDGRNDGTIVNNGVFNANHAAFDKTPAKRLQLTGNHDGSGGGIYRADDGILDLGNNLVLDGGTFDTSGVGIVEKIDSGIATLSNVTNLGQMGVRGQGGSITLTGPMTNNGNITLNTDGTIFNAHLRFGANTIIDGSGTVTMVAAGSTNDAQFFTDGPFIGTIGASQTVQGSGQVDGRSGGTIINNGTINGNDPAFPLELRGNHTASGVYRSDNGVLALINGASLDGGTFDSSGTGIVEMTSSGIVTLSNITNLGQIGVRGQGGIIELPTNLTNNGNVTLNTDGAIFNAHIRFVSDSAINGTGTINMATAGSTGDAQIIAGAGFVGTIGPGQSVSGDGLLVGELNVDGSLDPGGILRRFDIDTMHMSATSAMTADLGGLLGGEFDRLLLGGADTIDLDGTLTVNLDAGYSPVFGDTWDIVSGGTVNGQFATVILPAAGIGRVYRVIYESNLVFVVLTCQADLTGDNVLDFFDIALFLNYFTTGDGRSDLNGDGAFDFFDIALFLQILGDDCL